jgi:hypothetical protein
MDAIRATTDCYQGGMTRSFARTHLRNCHLYWHVQYMYAQRMHDVLAPCRVYKHNTCTRQQNSDLHLWRKVVQVRILKAALPTTCIPCVWRWSLHQWSFTLSTASPGEQSSLWHGRLCPVSIHQGCVWGGCIQLPLKKRAEGVPTQTETHTNILHILQSLPLYFPS